MVRPKVERSYAGVSAAQRRSGRRVALLREGRRIWGESGQAAVTVRGVCKAAGLTDRYFYEHFASREELLVAIADEVRDLLLGTLIQVGLTSPGSPEQRLRAALHALLEVIATDPHVHHIAAGELSPLLLERRRSLLATMAAIVVEYAPAQLGIEPDPPSLARAALFVAGGLSQLVEAWLDGTLELSTGELAEHATGLILRALVP
ncbi:TetR/AcrR family transcriptional regulator [Nocardia asteroides]|uniref:TetR/AcrR family transcriptional regulator n=1 Tax=Nocardia asteroides TaxID=1824 RepID=UPI001E6542D5|nr:TetR/AcrR family transcriptional regulator [Nocardia asteroides]UGT61763.1 TetR/AcrR family transcriptional regulator [Nocardia asteroides]